MRNKVKSIRRKNDKKSLLIFCVILLITTMLCGCGNTNQVRMSKIDTISKEIYEKCIERLGYYSSEKYIDLINEKYPEIKIGNTTLLSEMLTTMIYDPIKYDLVEIAVCCTREEDMNFISEIFKNYLYLSAFQSLFCADCGITVSLACSLSLGKGLHDDFYKLRESNNLAPNILSEFKSAKSIDELEYNDISLTLNNISTALLGNYLVSY